MNHPSTEVLHQIVSDRQQRMTDHAAHARARSVRGPSDRWERIRAHVRAVRRRVHSEPAPTQPRPV
jgi:uncharacterized protein YktB (UPF0637 family)